jgi:hypothetical protein
MLFVVFVHQLWKVWFGFWKLIFEPLDKLFGHWLFAKQSFAMDLQML